MTIILLLLGLILLIGSFFIDKDPNTILFRRLACSLGMFFLVITPLWAGYYSVPAGSRGVLLQFGAVQGKLDEGAHFVVPFIQAVEVMEVRTRKEAAEASAASKDLQTVKANVAINYHINPDTVGVLYRTVGTEYATRIIDPATQETVKAVVANYTAEELIRLRGQVKAEIDEGLTTRLAKYNIIVEVGGVSLTNFEFGDEFNKAIERKQVAQQTAEQQKYELQRAELEAKTNVASAKGKAEAAKIEAEALNSTGGSKVLMRVFLEKWDGRLPMVSGENGMILDLKEILKTAKE